MQNKSALGNRRRSYFVYETDLELSAAIARFAPAGWPGLVFVQSTVQAFNLAHRSTTKVTK
jgi:hypothetical protein